MAKYRITFSKKYGKKIFSTIVNAENEEDAFIEARNKCEESEIDLPDEVWIRTEKLS